MATQGFSISTFLKNVGSGWIALFVGSVVGFVSLPLMMKSLGEELYGVAALTTSLIAMFQYLSFGLPPTILRFFSIAFAKNDVEEAQKIASTSQLLMGGLGLLGALGFLCCYPWFVDFYEIREAWRAELWILFLATAFNFAETFFLAPFFAVLQARNRYDIGNYNRVIASLIRLAVLWTGFRFWTPTLATVASAYFLETLFRTITIIALALRLEGTNVIFRKKCVAFKLLPQFFSFSFLILVKNIFFGLSLHMPMMIVGKNLGEEMVAAFSPSIVFSSFLMSLLASVSTPLTPLASQDAVKTNGQSLKRWAIILSETLAWFGFTLVAIIGVTSDDLLALWMGEKFVWTSATFTVIAAGVVIAQIQGVNVSMAVGASAVGPAAYSAIVMAVLAIGGVWIGTAFAGWSILGVACCLASVRVMRNAGYLAFAYSRLFGYNYWKYLWRVYCKPPFYAICVVGVGRWLKANYGISEPSLIGLIMEATITGGVCCLLGWRFIDSDIKNIFAKKTKIPKWCRKFLRLPN